MSHQHSASSQGLGRVQVITVRQLWLEVSRNLREVSKCLKKVPDGALSLLKAPTSAFTIKNLLRHYANQVISGHGDIREGLLRALVVTVWREGWQPTLELDTGD